MIDNFEIIEPLLKWNSDDDFYFLQIIQRKKDAVEGEKVNGCNNNSRLVKAYYVKSLDYLEFIKPEVIELCKVFNARAGINLNKRSFEKTALQTLKLVTDNLINKNYDKINKAYSSACGKFSHDKNKKWIIDIDKEDLPFVNEIAVAIALCDSSGGSNYIAAIPSKTGLHLITTPFNTIQFKELLQDIMLEHDVILHLDIQKNNPTNLYIP